MRDFLALPQPSGTASLALFRRNGRMFVVKTIQFSAVAASARGQQNSPDWQKA
jgi:hypothetical protein